MRALRPVHELALAILAVVAVIALSRDPRPGGRPTLAEAMHRPWACPVCRHPNSGVRPVPDPGPGRARAIDPIPTTAHLLARRHP
jgi:hypothetical protein